MAEYQYPSAVSNNSVSAAIRTTTTIATNLQPKSSSVLLASSSSAVCKGKITTIFFDLDNTLIPTRSGDSKACRKLAEVLENNFCFTKEDSTSATQAFLKAFRRCPDNSQTSLDSWRTYLWREALPARHKHLAEQIYERWLRLRYRQLALPNDYVALLRAFRERGYRLALITNGPSNAQWEKIRKLNVSPYFDCVLVSSDLPWEKPNPNIFYTACNFLRVKPAECAMVGDKLETDIKGGRLAGLAATFWTPLNPGDSMDLSEEEFPPDFVLKNILDLCKYFTLYNAASTGSVTATTTTLTTAATAITTLNTQQQQQQHQAKVRRSSQQFSCNTTSTCKQCDHYPFQQFSNTQQAQQHLLQQQHKSSKYRRGGSLPAFECMNSSETENSSDSLFN